MGGDRYSRTQTPTEGDPGHGVIVVFVVLTTSGVVARDPSPFPVPSPQCPYPCLCPILLPPHLPNGSCPVPQPSTDVRKPEFFPPATPFSPALRISISVDTPPGLEDCLRVPPGSGRSPLMSLSAPRVGCVPRPVSTPVALQSVRGAVTRVRPGTRSWARREGPVSGGWVREMGQ